MMKVAILGVDEEARILEQYLTEKGINAKAFYSAKDVNRLSDFSVCVMDDAFKLDGLQTVDEAILQLKERYGFEAVYVMSYLGDVDLDVSMYEDGHLYKPLTRKDLEIFHRILVKNEKRELVCLFLGLRFYASPERATLLKSRVTDVLLRYFEEDGLVGVDVRMPPVDLTPSFNRLKKSKKHEQTE